MKKNFTCYIFSIIFFVFSLLSISEASGPKYVFLFIGDGMSIPQVNSAEYYLTSLQNACENGKASSKNCYPFPNNDYSYDILKSMPKIGFTSFPYLGIATTFGTNSFVPDSADTGTALATGYKTKSGVISMDPNATIKYPTIAEAFKKMGRKVGIVSSVSIDHATPAVFYAHQASRNDYYEIALQIPTSGFDYFAGGGFKKPTGPNKDQKNVVDIIKESGMKYVNTRSDFDALKYADNQRVVAVNPSTGLDKDAALYYAIDQAYYGNDKERFITLAEYTKKGIELLNDTKGSGFFMMVESGKIDWANHANDAASSIKEVIDFDNAIKVAVDFYNQNPNDTLIIVTGDHECGGMTIGFAGTKYTTNFSNFADQKMSYIEFSKIVSDYKNNKLNYPVVQDLDDVIKTFIKYSFNIDYSQLTDFQKSQLEDAYDRTLAGKAIIGSEEDYLLYGGYDAFTVQCTHTLAELSGVTFTSYSHTGLPVPVYAIGNGAEKFIGQMSNVDVPKKICSLTNCGLIN